MELLFRENSSLTFRTGSGAHYQRANVYRLFRNRLEAVDAFEGRPVSSIHLLEPQFNQMMYRSTQAQRRLLARLMKVSVESQRNVRTPAIGNLAVFSKTSSPYTIKKPDASRSSATTRRERKRP